MESERIELSFSPCKGLVLPLDDDPLWWAALDSNQECHKATNLQSAALPIPLTDPYISFKTHRVFQFTYWTYRNSHGLNSTPNFSFSTN